MCGYKDRCITNGEPWKMSPVWEKLLCWLSLAGQICPLDVFVAGCCCPLHETVASLATMACGWWHDWLWWPYRSPAWGAGLWPETWHQNRVGWQQDRSILAPAPLFSVDPRGDRGLISWGGIEWLQYSTYDGQLALQFHNHTDGKWWVKRFPVGPCRH